MEADRVIDHGVLRFRSGGGDELCCRNGGRRVGLGDGGDCADGEVEWEGVYREGLRRRQRGGAQAPYLRGDHRPAQAPEAPIPQARRQAWR